MLERLLSVRDAMLLAFLPPPGQPATAAAAAAGPGAGQQQQRGAWAAEGRAGAGGAAGPATAGEATSEREGEEEEEMRQQSAGAEAAGSSGLRPAPPSVGQQALEDDGDEPMDLGDPGAPGAGAKDSTRSSDIPDIADLQAADIELQLPHPPAPGAAPPGSLSLCWPPLLPRKFAGYSPGPLVDQRRLVPWSPCFLQ